jgi:Uncharacterized protein conserved in bacteria
MFYGSNARTFKFAQKLRKGMTDAEKILWSRLSNKRLHGYRFKRQHPIQNFIADFYCHKAKLIIEVDGRIHEQPQQILHDQERTARIKEAGCRILRFTNNEVKNQIDTVVHAIELELKVASSDATSPSGEAGGASLTIEKYDTK